MMLYIVLIVVLTFANGQEFTGDDDDCGIRPAVRPQPRIFNGRDARTGSWPWIGRILPRPETWECHAVLINDRWALTPVTCGDDPGDTIVFGDNEIDGTSPYRQEVGIRRAYRHPEYILLTQNELTLLQLDAPVSITEYVSPICLSRMVNESEAYDNCWIAGWGELNANSDFPELLQEASSRPLPSSECPRHETVMCTVRTSGESRACGDDVGGPMMCSGDSGQWYLLGQFTGYAGNCGDNNNIYSRISYLADYIVERVQRVEECSDPDYLCSDGVTCVLDYEICDRVGHCPDADDEIGCTTGPLCTNTTCLNGGTCIDQDEGFECQCMEGVSGVNCEIVSCGLSTIMLSPGSSVNLTSPLYPQSYPSSTRCEYNVTVPNGYKILVDIVEFDVEQGFDFLSIDDSIFSSTNIPSNWTSVGESLRIRFTSDEVYQTKGFWFRLSPIDITGIDECLWNPCEFDGTCIDETDGYSCQCVDDRLGQNCITPIDFCGPEDIILESGSAFNLISFYYSIGNKFNAKYSCKYNIVAPEGYRVRVQFVDVSLSVPWDSLFLGRYAYNSSEVGKEYYVSDGNDLQIIYVTIGFPNGEGINLALSAEFVDVDACVNQPCQNGGICYDEDIGFTCKCRRGYTGKTCERGLSRCGRNQFMCRNRRCIKSTYVCDGRNNCGDGSDELDCDCEFECYNGRCIPERFVCDGHNNCKDFSDEFRPNCER